MSANENGFEYRGRFYRWHVSDIGKDLMLIDRIAQMPVREFMELVVDAEESERTPVLLTLIATSLRCGHPDWSVDRIFRTVMNLSLGEDVSFVYAASEDEDEEVDEALPPSGSTPTEPPSSEPGSSRSNGSSSPSTLPASTTSKTSSATRA